MNTIDCSNMGIEELNRYFKLKKLTPVDLLECQLAKIEAHNLKINAFTQLDIERARVAAVESKRRWDSGTPIGLLDGVTFCAKDNQMVTGLSCRNGSLVTTQEQSKETSPSVARCMEEGAIFIGLTTMPEFGSDRITASPLTGTTTNPWDTSKHSGGSSGGAAAAVAAGFSTFAIATDAGGSIRIPSSFCGVTGFKPSGGRIPAFPASVAGALSCVGPITKSVRDTIVVMSVISRPDYRDPFVYPIESNEFIGISDWKLRSAKIAWSEDLGYASYVDKEILGAIQGIVDRLKNLGATIEKSHPNFSDPNIVFGTVVKTAYQHSLRMLSPEQKQQLGPGLKRILSDNPASLEEYLDAIERTRSLARAASEFFVHYDFLITPTVAETAFDADLLFPHRYADNPRGWSPFTGIFNLTQQPAITIPVGLSAAGLPIGLQLTGPHGADLKLLSAAQTIQQEIASIF